MHQASFLPRRWSYLDGVPNILSHMEPILSLLFHHLPSPIAIWNHYPIQTPSCTNPTTLFDYTIRTSQRTHTTIWSHPTSILASGNHIQHRTYHPTYQTSTGTMDILKKNLRWRRGIDSVSQGRYPTHWAIVPITILPRFPATSLTYVYVGGQAWLAWPGLPYVP